MQNMAGVCRLRLPVKELLGLVQPGQNVTLRHAETLQHSGIVDHPQPGMLYVDNLKGARASDVYIFNNLTRLYPDIATEAVLTYEPKFTYHGFRCVLTLCDKKYMLLEKDNCPGVFFPSLILVICRTAWRWRTVQVCRAELAGWRGTNY